MSSKDKFIKKIENNPKNVSIEEITKLLSWYGYEVVSITGSHHKFSNGVDSIVVPYKKPVREVYVKQILKKIKDL